MKDDLRPILVTGATGNVGKEVVRALEARGTPYRAAVRRPGAGQGTKGKAGQDVFFDFARPETFDEALRGARGVFLLRPPAIAKVGPTLNALIDRAVAAGVEQVVFLSVEGADRQRWIPHHAVERHLMASPIAWTFLRAGFFAQNFGDAYRKSIAAAGEIVVPAGGGRVAFVDVRDLSELAARAFDEPALRRQAWTLTGPEALSFAEAARILSDVTGRPIRYRAASVLGYLRHVRAEGAPWAQALVQTLLHVGLRFGNAETVDPALERLLGRPPRSFRDYAKDHRALFAEDRP